MRRAPLWVAAGLLAGCTIDLPLGHVETHQDAADAGAADAERDAELEPDAASPDAGEPDSGSLDAGQSTARVLQIGAIPTITCADTLGGFETDFFGLGASDVHLTGGDVNYVLRPSSATVSGAVLQAAFQTTQLLLEKDVVPDQPIGTFLGAFPIEGGIAGPDATLLDVAAVYIDTLRDPPVGEAGFQFETANMDGACFLSFSITLAPP